MRLSVFYLSFVLSFAPFGALASIFGTGSSLPGLSRIATLRAQYAAEKEPIENRIGNKISGKMNESCAKAHLSDLEFTGITGYRSGTNYCEVPVSALPLDVVAMIEKIDETNTKIATLLGLPVSEVFSEDLKIMVRGDFLGSMGSEAKWGRVFVSALPDWKYTDFSTELYAHEVMHILTFNDGPVADALLGLQDHPFLHEALPDLISTTIHDFARIQASESNLPDCLRNVRDMRGDFRGMNESFRSFYTLASYDKVLQCCDTIDFEQTTPLAKVVCSEYDSLKSIKMKQAENYVSSNEVVTTSYEESHLAAPFQAENCRIQTKNGLVYLENCDTHQFAYPLVSFFFRLKELTGKSQVAFFFSKLREGSAHPAIFQCGFTRGVPGMGGEKAYLALRPLLGSFMALRESFSPADQKAFDRAWNEQGFGKMVDLDRIYRTETLSGTAYIYVKEKNTVYRDLHVCGDQFHFDPKACGVECRQIE